VKTTTPSRPSIATETIPAERISVNRWNPNRMTAAMYAKALESIKTYGFVDPLTVREDMTRGGIEPVYEIIDGEHRFRAGSDLGMTEFPCVVVHGLTDDQARKLTVVLNELHGQADPDKMGDLLSDLLSRTDLEDLMVALPYDESVLAGFLGTLPSLPELVSPEPAPAPPSDKEPWVERLYRMPKSVSLIIDEAIEKAADGEKVEKWQALERVCADYLAG